MTTLTFLCYTHHFTFDVRIIPLGFPYGKINFNNGSSLSRKTNCLDDIICLVSKKVTIDRFYCIVEIFYINRDILYKNHKMTDPNTLEFEIQKSNLATFYF